MLSWLNIGVDPTTGINSFDQESIIVFSTYSKDGNIYPYMTDLFHFQFTLHSSLQIKDRSVLHTQEPIYTTLFDAIEDNDGLKVAQTLIRFLENKEEYSEISII